MEYKLTLKQRLFSGLTACMLLTACADNNTESSRVTGQTENSVREAMNSLPQNSDIVVAINVGGDAYLGNDGIYYAADVFNLPASKHASQNIQGTQDPTLYQSYRKGEMQLAFPLDNGAYDITFKFAEPENREVGDRTFDIKAESQTIIDDLDVRLARDGKILSALVRTVPEVKVEDGELNLSFKAQKGAPVLHGLIVRKKFVDTRNWELVWQDEFEQDGRPNPEKWSFDIWPARKVNDEDQAYTDRAKNARVENGHLIIEAHKEKYGNAEYTSARLHNKGKGDFLYGRADIRAKLAGGQGTWSAIWMLPSDPFRYATSCEEGEDWQGSSTCDAWPNSGEIDIMEHVGYDMNRIHGTVHNKAYYWMNWEQRKASIEASAVDQTFHVYSLEWSPEYIIISYDDTPYFYYRNQGEGWRAWPFDHPYHLILNLAIGGAWGRAGGPIDNSVFPARMEVDYVRIYKLAEQN